MKLHIAFDSQDMEQALQLAQQIAPAVDIIEIGTPLLFAYGVSFLERWEMVKGNTDLPIFISASITSDQATPALSLRPAGIVVSSTALDLSNPLQDIARLRSHM